MKVHTLKPHGNCFGEQYDKAVGDEYEHPAPKADLTLGNVCAVGGTVDSKPYRVGENASNTVIPRVKNAGDDKADGNAGSGKKAGAGKGRNSKKQDAQGSKRGG